MAETEERKDPGDILINSFLHLEEVDVDLFRGSHLFIPIGARSVYGGQVVALALKAAYSTIPKSHSVNSVHCYYLKGASKDIPILYHVDHTREGRTYSNCNVKAIQDGSVVFTMQASFKKDETDPFCHQMKMPDVPGPEGLLSYTEIMERQLGRENVSDARRHYIKRKLSEKVTHEVRYVDMEHLFMEEPHVAKTYHWIKAIGDIGDDPRTHECIATYISDNVASVALLPSAMNSRESKSRFFMASLDHMVWFHNSFNINDWMLFEKESQICKDGRGMTHGRLWRRDGPLAMSIAQECVIRTFNSKL